MTESSEELRRRAPDPTSGAAVVIGGGITGLAAALVLSARFARVTILERDLEPDAATPREAFDVWRRRGAVQVRHSHAFLGRLRNLLRDRHPDLLAALVDAGARELRMLDFPPVTLGPVPPEPGDDDLVMLGCRRITFEWVLRRYLRARANVDIVAGALVDGLVAEPGDPPRVTGVRFRVDGDARELTAAIVVDASGRQSPAPRWLEEIGARAPREETDPSGIVYYTRFYRLRPGAEEPAPDRHPGAADYNWIKFAIFPTDDRTFSITLAAPLAFPEMKVLARTAAFDEVARSLPAVARWIDPARAEPIGDPERPVQAMGGLINRLRRFCDERGPLALGLFALGDAAYCTNPLYGRGCAQGFLHAEMLGEALDRHGADLAAAARALDAAARREIEPFYRASVIADREAVRKAEGRRSRSWRARLAQRFFEDGVAVATRCDPVVYRAFVRMMNMLETPEVAFGRRSVVLRSLRVWMRGRRRNRAYAIPDGPDRAEVLARCERALARET
ncbi:MAG TPA: FAD-dependent oxidoreductase [Candidatus Binatia bacterium]|nr:FAD-dependent oxidoreductase [Candidatus Binatia bacterium]